MSTKMKLVKAMKKVCCPITAVFAGLLLGKGLDTGHPIGAVFFVFGSIIAVCWGYCWYLGITAAENELASED